MDLAALKLALASPEGQAMSDAQAAAWLNEVVASTPGELGSVPLRQNLVQMVAPDPRDGILPRFWRSVAATVPDFADQTALGRWLSAQSLLEAYETRIPINFGNAYVRDQAGVAVALGLMTQAQLDLLLGDAARPVTRAEQLGLGPVTHIDIAEARRE